MLLLLLFISHWEPSTNELNRLLPYQSGEKKTKRIRQAWGKKGSFIRRELISIPGMNSIRCSVKFILRQNSSLTKFVQCKNCHNQPVQAALFAFVMMNGGNISDYSICNLIVCIPKILRFSSRKNTLFDITTQWLPVTKHTKYQMINR